MHKSLCHLVTFAALQRQGLSVTARNCVQIDIISGKFMLQNIKQYNWSRIPTHSHSMVLVFIHKICVPYVCVTSQTHWWIYGFCSCVSHKEETIKWWEYVYFWYAVGARVTVTQDTRRTQEWHAINHPPLRLHNRQLNQAVSTLLCRQSVPTRRLALSRCPCLL